jgi:phosphoribosylformylglycinamidine synthase subunit PurS
VVNDPQGLAIADGLRHLGYSTVATVRAGKYIVVTLSASEQQEAERLVDEMCYRLLANPVIEDYRFEVLPQQG